MKNSKAFALVEILIVSTIIATILMYVFIQFNKVESKYDESFRYNGVDNLYNLDSIKEYIDSIDTTLIIDKINNDDIIIMDKNDDTYTNIEYLDNQVDLLTNLDIKTLVLTKADINNVDTSSLSKTLKNMIKKIDNKSDNYRIIAEFNNGECATITVNFDDSVYDSEGNKYKRVEYLESTGTQYIDTGVIPNGNSRMIIDQVFLSNTFQTNGSLNRNGMYDLAIGIYQSKWFFRYGSTGITTNILSDNKLHTFEISDTGGYIDNNKVASFVFQNFSTNLNLYIGARNTNTGIEAYCISRIYNSKLYDSENLVRDYIPVIDSSSRPCLFDKVGKECYYNQGTGEFLYG